MQIYIHVCVYIYIYMNIYMGFPRGSVVKNLLANAGDVGLITGLGRAHGEWNGNLLNILVWEINPMDRGAWLTIVHVPQKKINTF